jgi:Holliday junction resolvase RusA-like endonuclease
LRGSVTNKTHDLALLRRGLFIIKPRTIVLSGEPKSTQHVYRSTCVGGYARTYLSNNGQALKEAYQHGHSGKKSRSKGRLRFQSRSTSAPNAALTGQLQKVSLDALTGIAYLDDSQIGTLTIARAYDKRYPRITIDITPA